MRHWFPGKFLAQQTAIVSMTRLNKNHYLQVLTNVLLSPSSHYNHWTCKQNSQRCPASLHVILSSMSTAILLTHNPVLFLSLTTKRSESHEFWWEHLHFRYLKLDEVNPIQSFLKKNPHPTLQVLFLAIYLAVLHCYSIMTVYSDWRSVPACLNPHLQASYLDKRAHLISNGHLICSN